MRRRDIAYYYKRLGQARACALAASCEPARRAHEMLAKAYAERLLTFGIIDTLHPAPTLA